MSTKLKFGGEQDGPLKQIRWIPSTRRYIIPSLKTLKKWTRIRNGYQCQICGEISPINQGSLNVHHILLRSEGGPDKMENLCDLCHAVLHPHMGPAWVGLSKFPPEEKEQKRKVLEKVYQEFKSFLQLPEKERCRIQKEIWSRWGIEDNQNRIFKEH